MREALLLLGVLHLRQNDPHGARALLAATGWDVEPPEILGRAGAVYARALHELETVHGRELDAAARAGRALGVVGAARRALHER
jgi:hypothetical protein